MADTNATYFITVTVDMPDYAGGEVSFTLTTVPGIVGTEVLPGKTWELTLDTSGTGSIKLPTPDNTGTLAFGYNIGHPDGQYYRDKSLAYDAASLTLAEWLAADASDMTPDALAAVVSGKADKDTDAVADNVATFAAGGNPVDSGTALTDLAVDADVLKIASNLSDVASAATARANLGAVGGAGSSTDNQLIRFSGVGGDTIQESTSWNIADDDELTVDVTATDPTQWQFFNIAPYSHASSMSWHWNFFRAANPGDGTRDNVVMNIGYNQAPGGGRQDATDQASFLQLESHWHPGVGNPQFEWHVDYVNGAGTQVRPWGINIDKTTGNITANWKAHALYWLGGADGFNVLQATLGTSVSTSLITFQSRVLWSGDNTDLFIIKNAAQTKTYFTMSTTNEQFNVTAHVDAGFKVTNSGGSQIFGVDGDGHCTIGTGGNGSGYLYIFPPSNYYGLVLRSSPTQTQPMFEMRRYSPATPVLRMYSETGHISWIADQTTDTAPVDDTTIKKLTLQKLAAPPTNAAYVAFGNNPGSDVFYLVMEEG